MTIRRVGLTRDFLRPDGSPAFDDIGLDVLEAAPNLEWEFMPDSSDPLRPEEIERYDALMLLSPKVTDQTLVGNDRLRIIARFGVGIDNVDVDACTRAGVLLTITPDAVRRPVAASAMAFLLSLAHRLPTKDRLVRDGRWDQRTEHMGFGLVGRTLGIVGFGNIGRELAELARPFGLRTVAFDPYLPEATNSEVDLVDLETLLRQSDFVCVCCPLTEQTRHLIDGDGLALMKPTAFLINVARGPIVDQAALTEALQARSIMGAALDVFEVEPPDPDDLLLTLDNVILAPHAAAWTDEIFRDNGRSALQGIVDIFAGREPASIVNRDVLSDGRVRALLNGVPAHPIANGNDSVSTRAPVFRSIDHVGIAVRDMGEALTKYIDLLGLNILEDDILEERSARVVFVDTGSVPIQLVQALAEGPIADFVAEQGEGLHHVCFSVANIDETLVTLGTEASDGIFFLKDGRRACFLKDRPGGLLVELYEQAAGL